MRHDRSKYRLSCLNLLRRNGYDTMTGEGTYTPTCHENYTNLNSAISLFTCHPVINSVIPRVSTMTGACFTCHDR